MRGLFRLGFGWLFLPVARAWKWLCLKIREIAIALDDGLRYLLTELGTTVLVMALVLGAGWMAAIYLHIAWLTPQLKLTAFLTGMAAPGVYLFRRMFHDDDWRELTRRLNAPCRADNDPYSAFVEIEGRGTFACQNFLLKFRAITGSVGNVLLILRQTKKRWWNLVQPYSFESIQQQIEAYEASPNASRKKIAWVCFVTRDWTFVAYQSYERFAPDVKSGTGEYAKLLNITDVEEFVEQVKQHISDEAKQREKSARIERGTIPGLAVRMLPDNLSRRQALQLMNKKDYPDAMLLAKRDYKPIGVVSAKRLIEATTVRGLATAKEYEKLEKEFADWVAKIPVGPLTPDDPPAITTSHDDPELDANIETGSPPVVEPKSATPP